MIRTFFKIFVGIILTIVVFVGGFSFAISTEWGQKMIYSYVFELLQNTLQTRLDVKEIKVDIIRGRIMLHGLELDDKDGVTMLKVDSFGTQLGFTGIFNREIYLDEIFLKGASAVLYKKTPESETNYQFVIDAFKKKSELKKKEKEAPNYKKKEPFFHLAFDMAMLNVTRTNMKWDILSAPRKGRDTLDVNHLNIQDFGIEIKGRMLEQTALNVTWKNLQVKEKNSGMAFRLNNGEIRSLRNRSVDLMLKGINFRYQDKQVGMKRLQAQQRNNVLDLKKPIVLKIDSISFKNNNHKPRKNFGKPNRGWFDPGHLDAVASMDVTLHYLSKDSLYAYVEHVEALDKASGLDIRNLSTFVNRSGDNITLTKIFIAMMRTRIHINKVKMHGTRIEDFPFEADVYLQDISKPFAPPLSNFTTPLKLKVVCGGELDRYLFKNIRISTFDNRLQITGEGDLCNVAKKRELCLHFWNLKMSAVRGVKEQIVNHFSKKVRLKMQRQMKALGDIKYEGKVGIFFKREDISGRLFTKYGNVDFDFTLDGITRHMKGTMSVDSLNFGPIMNIKDLYIARTNATYDFDITSKRKAKALGIKRIGRLPIGTLHAYIGRGRYGKIVVRNLESNIESDGAVAKGHIAVPGGVLNIDVDFSYIQTDKEQNMRIHPKLAFGDKVRKFFGLSKKSKKSKEKDSDQEKSIKKDSIK